MTRHWSFDLNYPRAPKGLSANDRVHWSVKARATADIRYEVATKVRALGIGVLRRIRVEVVWVVNNLRRRDADGPDPMCKAIYDGICADHGVSAHLVADDAPEFIDKPRLSIRYERGSTPHFEVRITEVN